MTTQAKTRKLPVPMSPTEHIAAAKRLAECVTGIVDVKERAKAAAGVFRDEHKALSDEAKELALQVRTGCAQREVDVAHKANVALRTWEVIRTDTNELVDSVEMNDAEVRDINQLALPGTKAARAVAH